MPSRRRLVPTVLDAVVSVTPPTSLVTAFGLAGGGYLTNRADVAACGAAAGALGLMVERFGSRSVRVRLRRERAEHRTDLQDVSLMLREVQRDVAALRADLDLVRAERDAVREELVITLDQLDAAREPAEPAEPVEAIVPEPLRPEALLPEADELELVEIDEPELVEPETVEIAEPEPELVPLAFVPAQPPQAPSPLRLLLPGQMRSPIATGGIPLLAPGPSEPVRPTPRTSIRREPTGAIGAAGSAPRPTWRDDETQPLPVLTAELTDTLVYAALAQAEASAVSSADAGADRTPTLYVVRRGEHVA